MGNKYQVSWRAPVATAAQVFALRQTIEQQLDAVNASMSVWQPQSELSRFNALAAGKPMTLSPQLNQVLTLALKIGERSGGALDITVGPLVKLWGFGPGKQSRAVPNDEAIASVRTYTGLNTLLLESGRLTKSDGRTEIDLGAIAKGYGVDVIAEVMRASGHRNFLIDIGGELYASGQRQPGTPWKVGIDKPFIYSSGQVETLQLSNQAVATSGDYRNFFEQAGSRYSHVVDPRTGRAVQTQVVSATVVADRCAEADGLATAAMVMGVEAAMAMAERDGIAMMLIEDHFGRVRLHHSTEFQQFLR
ncbi:FAD:protein FMN transferase [Ferrimonas kyonanensis]|uniref:FAD:protein FMN transferase n=1 Tax=Ferrimonas kyonanensis TaxID=364763 RepID=UPI0004838FEE|nr:FAD:protein FMN transferase [Ferrimonas kyonanensis]